MSQIIPKPEATSLQTIPSTAAGGGAGANGTWTYDSGAAGLTFGTVIPGDTQEIAFTGLADGDVYVAYLKFSGAGAAGFAVAGFTRNGAVATENAPVDCATADEFTLACDDTGPKGSPAGASFSIQFSAAYTTGSEETMTVEMYDVNGTLVDTITATATVDDPWVGQVKTHVSAMGAWARSAASSGDIAPDEAAFVDLAGLGGPDFIAKIASLGNWAFDDSEGPAATGVLANCVTTKTNRGNSNFGAVASALAGDALSGMIIFRVVTPQTAGQRIMVAASLGIASNAVYGQYDVDRPRPWSWGDTAIGRKRIRAVDDPGLYPLTHGDSELWVTLTWRQNVAVNAQNFDYTLSAVGAAHGNIDHDSTFTGDTVTQSDGFRSFYNQNGTGDTSTGTVKLAGFALFSADIGQAALEALHDAVIP